MGGAVDGMAANSVAKGEVVDVASSTESRTTGQLDNVGVGVLCQIVDDDGRVDGRVKRDARVDGAGINDGDKGAAPGVFHGGSDCVKGWGKEADGVSSGDEHADGVLVKIDALVEGLLVPIVPDAVLRDV